MTILKQDLFGTMSREQAADGSVFVLRDSSAARWWLRGMAMHLARRERLALTRLAPLAHSGQVPQLISTDGARLCRSWIDGAPMQQVRPTDPAYFRQAMRLLRNVHSHDVAHNDLAKEPNWLVTADGNPALVDFQLALCARRRGKLFRVLAHDDLRHLLKHKRTYVPALLSARERRILATPSLISRLWMASVKPVYHFVTRRILHWADREGAGDRKLLP